MLLAGDEMGRTQGGNNNAYCQDNEISWLDWNIAPEERGLLEFVQRLIELRRERPVFRRGEFFEGRPIRDNGVKDIMWFSSDGCEMGPESWRQSHARCLGIYLACDSGPQGLRTRQPQQVTKLWRWLPPLIRGCFDHGVSLRSNAVSAASPLNRMFQWMRLHRRAIADGGFLILVNAHHEMVPFVIPGLEERVVWSPVFDTSIETQRQSNAVFEAGAAYELQGRSLVLLRSVRRGTALARVFAVARQ